MQAVKGRALNGAGVFRLCIAHLAGFVDFVAAKAKVCGGGDVVLINTTFPSALRHLSPVLSGVVFLRQPHLSAGADCKGEGLCPIIHIMLTPIS